MCENKKASHVPLTADTHIPLDCCFTPIFSQLENQPTHFREWVVTPLFEEERFVVVELEYLSHTHTLHDLHCTCRHLSVFTYIMPPLLPHTSPPLDCCFLQQSADSFPRMSGDTTVSSRRGLLWLSSSTCHTTQCMTYIHTCDMHTSFEVFWRISLFAHLQNNKRSCALLLFFCSSLL